MKLFHHDFYKIVDTMLKKNQLIHHERTTGWKDDLITEAYVIWLETGFSKEMCVRRAYDNYANKMRTYADKTRATVLPFSDIPAQAIANSTSVPENIDNTERDRKRQEYFEKVKPLLNKCEITIIDMLLNNKKIKEIATALGVCERTIHRSVAKVTKRIEEAK